MRGDPNGSLLGRTTTWLKGGHGSILTTRDPEVQRQGETVASTPHFNTAPPPPTAAPEHVSSAVPSASQRDTRRDPTGRRSRIALRWDACKRWMKIAWPALVAEGMSTALLVWMGCASCVSYDADPCATPPVPDIVKPEPALSFGLMVMMNTMLFGHVSGAHMNPAVTVGAVICHQLNIHVAGPYILAQTLGGMLGYGILYATVPGDKSASVCVTMPGTNVTQISALLVEIVITFTLVLVMCNLWVGDPMDPTVPIKVGLSYTGLIYSAFGATGASLNPARSIAPALFQNNLGSLWIYIVGPTAGGALAGLFARFVMRLPIPEIEPGLPPDA